MSKPVLFLVFNRRDVAERVFQEIKRAKPKKLYIASDGPRASRPDEAKSVISLREYLVESVNWECEVHTLFRDENLGCRMSVSSAITWFFQNEEDGIILEDDCLPHPSFFSFCEVLLDYYKDQKNIMHISGDQFLQHFDNGFSYYFSSIQHCWGWATWADRWLFYDDSLDNYKKEDIQKFSQDKNVQEYWMNILKRMQNAEIDSWAYQWAFNIVKNNGVCINPAKNLISNIGFGNDATHTMDVDNPVAGMKTSKIDKIIHPPEIKISDEIMDDIYRIHFHIEMSKAYKKKDEGFLRSIFKYFN